MELGETLAHNPDEPIAGVPDASLPQPEPEQPREITRVLDLFCGAGGAGMGYHRAWPNAEIIGVDLHSQPRYPFAMFRGDVRLAMVRDEQLRQSMWRSVLWTSAQECAS